MPDQEEKQKLLNSILFSLIILAVMWAVKASELIFGISLSFLGILPLESKGLAGIIFAPLIHADMAHLTANSTPFILLTAALVYYYRKESFRILTLLWIITGLWVWLFARGNSYHIGASGVVYALAAFHFTGGILRREPRLMAFSMLIIFLYGSLVWGFFPEFFPEKNISWESHLMGAIAGVLFAFYFRQAGPQARVYEWDEEDEDDENDFYPETDKDNENKENNPNTDRTINYHYKPD
ncbi:MAG: rhomboid family intramembrane serine protease [Lentimicrobium sp.]|nr:rhomboid family intramembrane serine protease [Lentimicrobium sp.]